ncbi:MAG: hypothetical protein ABI837_13780 [Acidobacteriota bacterium]
MGFTIDFIGLSYFHKCKRSGGLVLLPDGRNPYGSIPPHYASFFLEDARVDFPNSDWWRATPKKKLSDVHVTEFPILKPSEILISGLSENSGCWPLGGGSKLDLGNLHSALPELAKIDTKFRVDLKKAETIARLPIRRGTAEAFLFDGEAIVTRLTVESHSGPVTITARSDDGKDVKTLTVKDGTEIVLSNTSDLLAEPEKVHEAMTATGETHFRLYKKLDVNKAGSLEEPETLPHLDPFVSNHPYIVLIMTGPEVPGAGCSNTCC